MHNPDSIYMTYFILIQRDWEFSKNFGRQSAFWNLSQRDFNELFSNEGKAWSKIYISIKKKTKRMCNLDKIRFCILTDETENTKSTVRKCFLYLRRCWFFSLSNFSFITTIALFFVFKNIHLVHSKITLSFKEVFRFYSFFLKSKN